MENINSAVATLIHGSNTPVSYTHLDVYKRQGLVCLAKRGSVNEEQRAAVEAWLKGRDELQNYEISPLLDVWYPENPINQA